MKVWPLFVSRLTAGLNHLSRKEGSNHGLFVVASQCKQAWVGFHQPDSFDTLLGGRGDSSQSTVDFSHGIICKPSGLC
jgi:hypothetical protein